MYLVTAEDMRVIDARAVELGVPSLLLMESAGRALASSADEFLKRHTPYSAFVVILAGPGKNGGDGFCAARHLSAMGHKVMVGFFGSSKALPPDARVNLDLLAAYPVKVHHFSGPGDFDGMEDFEGADLIIDALFGTGLRGNPRYPVDEAIRWANSRETPIVACDIPSGLCADRGYPHEPVIRADLTVSMGLAKVGLYSYPGRKYAGEIIVESLSLPPCLVSTPSSVRAMTIEDARALMPLRQEDHHKGMSGHVAVVAGSLGMAGAAVLASVGALRAGAGTVTLLCPGAIYGAVAPAAPEVMVIPGGDSPVFTDRKDTVDIAVKLLSRCDSAVIGPGLGRGEAQSRFLREVLPIAACRPCVLDADGIFALRELGGLSYLRDLGGKFILTPHTGELARLLNVDGKDIERDRPGFTRTTAKDGFSVTCLKGAGTLVANYQGELVVNTTGDSAMATAGSGDVLTGVIAAAVSQGLSPFEGACLAVFWHGLAGEVARQRAGSCGVLAGEISGCLPEARRIIGREVNRPFVGPNSGQVKKSGSGVSRRHIG